MARHHNINGNIVPFTVAEETARDNEEATALADAPARALAELRNKRNRLLAATDYLALSDNTLTADMTTYRQALRDLPNGKDTVAKCTNTVFPTKP